MYRYTGTPCTNSQGRSVAKPGRRTWRVFKGTVVHHEQTVRLRRQASPQRLRARGADRPEPGARQ